MDELQVTHVAKVKGKRPDEVWSLLQEAATWQGLAFIDDVSAAETADGALRSFDFVASAGGRSEKGTAQVITSDGPTTMVVDVKSGPIAGTISVLLSGRKPTTIEVQLAAHPTGGLAKMFWGQISKAIERGFPSQVDAFAAGL